MSYVFSAVLILWLFLELLQIRINPWFAVGILLILDTANAWTAHQAVERQRQILRWFADNVYLEERTIPKNASEELLRLMDRNITPKGK